MPTLWPNRGHCPTAPLMARSPPGAAEMLRVRNTWPLMDVALWSSTSAWGVTSVSLVNLCHTHGVWHNSPWGCSTLAWSLPRCLAGEDGQLTGFDAFRSLCCSRIKSFCCIILHLQTSACWPYNIGAKEWKSEIIIETAPKWKQCN